MWLDSEKKDKQSNGDKKEERTHEYQVVIKNNNYGWCGFDGKICSVRDTKSGDSWDPWKQRVKSQIKMHCNQLESTEHWCDQIFDYFLYI